MNVQSRSVPIQNKNSSPIVQPMFFAAGTMTEDYIDSQSNIDSHADHGIHSAFNNLKATDSTMDLMTEANTGGGSDIMGANAGSGTSTTTFGADNARGTYASAPISGTVGSGVAYIAASSGTINAKMFITASDDIILSNGVSNPTAVSSAGGYTFTFGTPPSVTASTAYHIYIVSAGNSILLYRYDTTSGVSYSDTTNSYSSPINPTDRSEGTILWRQLYVNIAGANNYECNLEMDFASVDLGYDTYILAIKTGTHASGSEAFNVRIWDGAWDTVITGLNWSAWNNVTVTAYKASTMYVLFIGQTESGDTSQDTFNVDSVLLVEVDKTWNIVGTAQIWFDMAVWNIVATAIIYFWIALQMIALEGFFILFGLILIPVSTLYLVHGGKEDMSSDKVFFFFLLFFVGWALLIGGIMP